MKTSSVIQTVFVILVSAITTSHGYLETLTIHHFSSQFPTGVPIHSTKFAWSFSVSPTIGVHPDGFKIQVNDPFSDRLLWSHQLRADEVEVTLPPHMTLPASSWLRCSIVTTFQSATEHQVQRSSQLTKDFLTEAAPLQLTWIGGHNILRGNFHVESLSEYDYLVVHITGVGAFKPFVNGYDVSDGHYMDPGQTVYPVRMLYVSHLLKKDVLLAGPNTIDVWVGNYKWGYLDIWCNQTELGGPNGCRAAAVQVLGHTTSGKLVELLSTNDTSQWVGRGGPIVYDHLYHGENYDARLETGSDWNGVKQMHPLVGFLAPQPYEPLRFTGTYEPASVKKLEDGVWMLDFGQNMAGLTTLAVGKLRFPRGSAIIMRHGELQHPNGTLYNQYCTLDPTQSYCTNCMGGWLYGGQCANQTTMYIFNGDETPDKVYTPTFTAHGFRYVQVSSPLLKTAPTMKAYMVNTAVAKRGDVTFPDIKGEPYGTTNILNKINHMITSAQISNLWSIPTDCPQRERRGWMGDAHVSIGEAVLNFDMQAFSANFVQLIREDQGWGCTHDPPMPYNPYPTHNGACAHFPKPLSQYDGSVADVTPYTANPYGLFPGSPVWQTAYVVITHALWEEYQDRTILTDNYDGLKKWMAYLKRHEEKPGIITYGYLGDWNEPKPFTNGHPNTPINCTSAFVYLKALEFMVSIATELGHTTDADMYKKTLDQGLKNYNSIFYNEEKKTYCSGSQTSVSMAMSVTNLVPKDRVDELLLSLRNITHTTVGVVGMRWLFPVMSKYIGAKSVLNTLKRDDYPSFGYMLLNGATALWENWDGNKYTTDGSRNHIMFGGGPALFLYNSLLGLSSEAGAAWKITNYRPAADAIGELPWAKGWHVSKYGNHTLSWKATMSNLEISAHVPVSTKGNICGPTHGLKTVTMLKPVNKVVYSDGVCHTGNGVEKCEVRKDVPAFEYLAVVVASGQYVLKFEL